MRAAYQDAQAVGEKSGATDLYYPASNRLAADVALHAGTRRWRGLDRETPTILRQESAGKERQPTRTSGASSAKPSWTSTRRWPSRKLAPARKQLDRAYEDLHKRVTATRMWASVYDTACLVLPNYAESRDRQREGGRERAARATAEVRAPGRGPSEC